MEQHKASTPLVFLSCVALAAACLPALSWAQDMHESRAVESSVRSGNYNEAAALLETQARAGNAEAQYQLASLYRIGRGVAQNEAEAFRWMQQAANVGHIRAQYSLASMYLAGRGTSVDLNASEM